MITIAKGIKTLWKEYNKCRFCTYTTNDEQIYTGNKKYERKQPDNKNPQIWGKSNNPLPSNFITAKRGLVAKKVNSKVVALSLWHFLEKLKVNFEASLCNRLGHLSERNWMKRNAGTRFSSSNSYQNFWTICRV